MNYNYSQFLLTPTQFGIPNSRLRYYCLAKLDKFCFESKGNDPNNILKEYPCTFTNRSCSNCIKSFFLKDDLLNESDYKLNANDDYKLNEEKFKLKKVGDFLEDEKNIDLDQFRLKEKQVKKYLSAIDVVNRESECCCCFTSSYGRFLTGTGSFLLLGNISLDQLANLKKKPTELENTTDLFTLRQFTPKEIANILQFPSDFEMPPEFSLKQSYKLLGNSVNCKIISFLFKILLLNNKLNL